jgi:hypothetical protein
VGSCYEREYRTFVREHIVIAFALQKEIVMTQRTPIRKAVVVRPARRVRPERQSHERPLTQVTHQAQQEQQAEERDYGRLAQEADHLFDTNADWW